MLACFFFDFGVGVCGVVLLAGNTIEQQAPVAAVCALPARRYVGK